MANAAAILKRNAKLRSQRATYESAWQEIAEYIAPHRANIQRAFSPGEKKTDKIFDSTAVRAHPMLSAHLHQTLTPSTQPWLSFSLRDEALNEEPEVETWLEDDARRMHLAFKQSDFNVAVHEMYLDITGPSATGCLLVEEREVPASGGFGGFRFRAIPPNEYCLDENVHGRVDTIYRQFALSARQILQRWPKTAGQRVEEKVATDPDAEFQIVHAVYPRTDRLYDETGKPKRGAKNMPFVSCYVLMAGTNDDGKGGRGRVLEEGGYEEFPYMVPRWLKASGEKYGFGPAHLAIPDVRTMNKAKEFLLEAAPLSMFPPSIERDDSVLGDLDLTPGGRNVLGGTGPVAEQLAFLQTGVQVDITQIVFADLVKSIQETFFVPQLELQEGPQMTATEVNVRYELMMRYLGAVLERLTVEFLNPLVERAFGVMARARAFLPLPAMLAERFGEADLDVQYEGPLARAQRTMELTAQDRTIAFATAVSTATAPFAPDIARKPWDVLDLDRMMRDRGDITGLRTNNLRPQKDVDAERQAREDQAQQAQQAQTMIEGAKAMGAVAPMVSEMKPGQTGRAA